jgi:hypothetical protein
MDSAELNTVFIRLRGILQQHLGGFTVHRDTSSSFGFEGPIGPATVKAWKGKVRSPTIPIGWTEIGKNYVSYYLMGVYGSPKLLEKTSAELRARMQGKSCFNFTKVDEVLFRELDRLTGESVSAMCRGGFVAD